MQLADRQRRAKQPRSGKGQGKGEEPAAASSGAAATDHGLLQDTLRLTLQAQGMLRTAHDASSVTILMSADDSKTALHQLITSWFELLPKRTEQQIRDRIFPRHPMKLNRKVLAFQWLVEALGKARPDTTPDTEEPWKTLKLISEVTAEDMETQIQDCKPKYRNPKEGRKWVWLVTISALAEPEFRHGMTILVKHSEKFATGGLEVLQTYTPQPKLEKELWKRVRQ